VRRYLRDPMFSRFDTIPECDRLTHTHRDRQTGRHTTTAYTALSIASRGKNGSRDVTTPISGTVCIPYAETSYNQPLYPLVNVEISNSVHRLVVASPSVWNTNGP